MCTLQALGRLDLAEKGRQGVSWPKLCDIVKRQTGVQKPGLLLRAHDGNAIAAVETELQRNWLNLS